MARTSNSAARAVFALLALGCSEQTVTVELRSLQASGDVSYVCRTNDGDGVAQSECSPGSLFSGERDLYGLVTQTSTGEVAIVNVPFDLSDRLDDEGVVDVDPSGPGFGFLRIGARPGPIVSTPGGRATFVGVSEPGRPGIFALPTPCLGPPRPPGPNGEPGEAARDLTTWPACSLPAAPSGLAIALGPSEGLCDPNQAPAIAPAGRECAVDLATEAGPTGRRKLLVTMPDRGTLAVIDAQALLDRPQGGFEPCQIEVEVPLSVALPPSDAPPKVPADLEGCPPAPTPLPAAGPVSLARPTRISAADATLYIADEGAPVVHVVDVGNACAPRETPPLLPTSYSSPQRNVTVSRLAVSPLTPKGKRYVYAIDELDWPTSSVLAFDVSPGSNQRTPILRPGSASIPNEQPDRINFNTAVRDITFVMRDRPEFDANGVARLGEACDPDPRSDSTGTRYRPNVDRGTGSRPYKLRGLFGMAMLTTGEVALIDVEDFDAPCRRPVSSNAGPTEDFRGCANDPLDIAEYASNGLPTVTDEVSCRAVEPHRLRAQRLAITRSDFGTEAPSLRSLPTLTVPNTTGIRDASERPKLLAVEDLARVYVGTTEYRPREGSGDRGPELDLDPSVATDNSVALPFNQLRAYRNNEQLTLEYEGSVSAEFRSGFFVAKAGKLELSDPSALYCDSGVSDPELMIDVARDRFGLVAAADAEPGDARPTQERFAEAFADHVVITADFPEEDDAYWPGIIGHGPDDPPTDLEQCSRNMCEEEFGELPDRLDISELVEARQFSIENTEQQRMSLEPRYYLERRAELEAGCPVGDGGTRACTGETAARLEELEAARNRRIALAQCCFPTGSSYQVRASRHWTLWSSAWQLRHDVIAVREPDGRLECRHDCDPRKRENRSRIFEIATEACTSREDGPCQLNVCTTDTRRAVNPADPAWACVHGTSTARFALYQGLLPSERGMAFSWQVVGGFTPLTVNLAFISSFVSPQAIVPLPDLDRVSIVDAASLGLAFVSLDGLRPLIPTVN